jgi:hypothetical protein
VILRAGHVSCCGIVVSPANPDDEWSRLIMKLETVIFDVDGLLVASPDEPASRAALQDLMAGEWRSLVAGTTYTPERFTSKVYQGVCCW